MLAIVGGTVHTIANGVEPGHSVLIRDGKIEAIVPGGPVPEGYDVLDATGQVVLPGLVDARTSAGLYGDGSGFQNADHEELTDPDTAWVRALDALDPHDPVFADARQAGVTTLLTGPGSTNVAGGLSVVIKTVGNTPEAMIVREPAGLQLGLGRPAVCTSRDKHKVWTRMGVVALLRERLTAARSYLNKQARSAAAQGAEKQKDPPEHNLRLEPYAGLLRREYPARMRVATAEDAWTALRLADEFGFDLVLEQLTEGHLAGLPDELARRGVPCVLGPMMKAGRSPETKALTFQAAVVLAKAGVPVALCSGHPSRPIGFLMLEAGLAVRAGLSEEAALCAVTAHPAAALGLSDRIGTLEAGKDADVIVFDGDPFLPTSRVRYTVIGGQVVYGT